MSPIQRQFDREQRYDTFVYGGLLVIFFGCMALLPRSFFWFYLVPLAAFYVRYTLVRSRRDDALLLALQGSEVGTGVRDGMGSAAGCYRSEAGICISDGTHHILVARNQPDTLLQLRHVVGRE